MTKKLNTDSVLTDLRESSAFFRDAKKAKDDKFLKDKKNVRSNEPTNVGTNEIDQKERKKIRHTFDIFQDQLISLKEIRMKKEGVTGKRILLGKLVQLALDKFIKGEIGK